MAEDIKLKQEETGTSASRQDDAEFIPQVATTADMDDGKQDMASSRGISFLSHGLGATAAEPPEGQPETYLEILQSQGSSRSESDFVIDMEGIGIKTPYVDQLQPKGVPFGGVLYEFDTCKVLENTCNLDQLLNGLVFLITLFPLIRKRLETLARRFPLQYERLFEAVQLCECGLFAYAKHYLVPEFNMENKEGKQVMPLLEGQLCHWFVACCGSCNDCRDVLPIRKDIALEMNDHSTVQAALKAYFAPPNGTCFNERCGGQTNVKVIFDTREPPLILPINLYLLRNHIPSTQVINFREDVVLFNKRYMIFLVSVVKPHDPPNPGAHYMSYVFRPEEGSGYDTEGRPIGNWYWYPNDYLGSLELCTPGSRDPVGSRPSYIYFIKVPPPSSEEGIPANDVKAMCRQGRTSTGPQILQWGHWHNTEMYARYKRGHADMCQHYSYCCKGHKHDHWKRNFLPEGKVPSMTEEDEKYFRVCVNSFLSTECLESTKLLIDTQKSDAFNMKLQKTNPKTET